MTSTMAEYFTLFCSGIMALATICGAVYWTVKQTIAPLKVEVDNIKESLAKVTAAESDKAKADKESETRLAAKFDEFAKELFGKIDKIKEDLGENYIKKSDCEKQMSHCDRMYGKKQSQ